jgi:cell wall-associated NlpC family hydrolase
MAAERVTLRRVLRVVVTGLLSGAAAAAMIISTASLEAGVSASQYAAVQAQLGYVPAVVTEPAPAAALMSSVQNPRWQAYLLALSRRGDWYSWGGDGPDVFDCSGLVAWAYSRAGVPPFGRTTYQMLGSGRLRPVPWSQAQPGDLVFFGAGHVELYVSPHVTYGALETGTQIGFHRWYPGSWWVPSAVYAVSAG